MGRIKYSTIPKYSKMEPSGWLTVVGGSGAEVGKEPSRYMHYTKDTNKLSMDT